MSYKEYRDVIDKSDWGHGPWDSEPDKIEWVDPETGYDCIIRRSPLGALCGYVGIPESHALFGLDYDDLNIDLEVHGGITWTGKPDGDEVPIDIRLATEHPKQLWWIGFDCAHAFDLAPAMRRYTDMVTTWPDDWTQVYRDMEYVRSEVLELAKQLDKAR